MQAILSIGSRNRTLIQTIYCHISILFLLIFFYGLFLSNNNLFNQDLTKILHNNKCVKFYDGFFLFQFDNLSSISFSISSMSFLGDWNVTFGTILIFSGCDRPTELACIDGRDGMLGIFGKDGKPGKAFDGAPGAAGFWPVNKLMNLGTIVLKLWNIELNSCIKFCVNAIPPSTDCTVIGADCDVSCATCDCGIGAAYTINNNWATIPREIIMNFIFVLHIYKRITLKIEHRNVLNWKNVLCFESHEELNYSTNLHSYFRHVFFSSSQLHLKIKVKVSQLEKLC